MTGYAAPEMQIRDQFTSRYVLQSNIALVSLYLILTPLLWVLGIHVLAGVALIAWLALRRWPEDQVTNLIVACWFAVGIAQAVAIVHEWASLNEDLSDLVIRLLTFSIIGWWILGICVAVGQSWQLTQPRVVRAIMVLGLHILIFSFGTVALVAAGQTGFEFPTPLRLILGSSPAVEFYTYARVFINEDSFGFELPRLVLFFPWSAALALAGIAIFLIGFCERGIWWRYAGMGGGLCAIVFSLSRSALVVFPVVVALYCALRMRTLGWACLLAGFLITGLGCVVLDINPLKLISDFYDAFTEARPGSSEGRMLIYEHSWEGFLNSPIFGHGWIGDSVIAQEPLPIGSHSTFYGTLYIGGLAVFLPLIIATLATFAALLTQAVEGRQEAAVATAILLAIAIISVGETIYSIIPSILFVFMFLGGALPATRMNRSIVSGRDARCLCPQ